MADRIPPGTSVSRGDTHTLRFVLSLPHPQERVWLALTTPGGLRGWLAEAQVLESRLGGEVALRWLTTQPPTVVSGTVTAWDVERIVEYTVEAYGRMRFDLEPGGGPAATALLFVNEFRGTDDFRLDRLAGWHDHFLYLAESLDGRPADWPAWSRERRQDLRDQYEARDFGAT
ncbi:SRPBCC domain-containing protein [Streptomyces gobitricini]|uniref:Activator of Hsp90 ATPase homologue 1/2-like C-terminal domain-containing protein n=1 Tax=Streptomyces gobitricini TaxID=68211 RepID=A0ABN3MLI6_9ACTN